MLAFPASPVTGQVYLNWWWDGAKWMRRSSSIPKCGLFQIVGSSPSSTVKFAPYNGDLIKINGSICQIPASGLSTGSTGVYIDGVIANMVLSTLYYVYATMSIPAQLGNMQIEYSTTAPAQSTTSGNAGVWIKSGDDTRTLIGIAYPAGSGSTVFYDQATSRYIRSWFNRQNAALAGVGNGSGWGGGITPIVNLSCVAFAGETIYMNSNWTITSGATQAVYLDNQLNGGNTGRTTPYNDPAGSYNMMTAKTEWSVSAGAYTLTAAVWAQAQTLGPSNVGVFGWVM